MSRIIAIVGPGVDLPAFVRARAAFGDVLLGTSDAVIRRGPLAVVAHAIDAGQILDAYERGDLDALEGEFVFALWDDARKQLVAARDRFGVRPLYEATRGAARILTNTLPALLELVPRDVDVDRLGDVLTHGVNLAIDKTTWRAIGRIPPAHSVTLTPNGERRLTRYWQLPIAREPLRITEREAQEELRARLVQATKVRASGNVVIAMSGGVDSTAVAASLVHAGVMPRALTSVWDSLIPDVERRYAGLTARHLGIPIDFQACDAYRPFERWDEPRVRGYEPKDEPFSAAFLDFVGLAARHGEVLCTGQGGDPILRSSRDYFFNLLRRGRVIRFAHDALGYAFTRRKLPPLLLRSRIVKRPPSPPPDWLRPHLQERWHGAIPTTDARVHPFRNDAFQLLAQTNWPAAFETWDPGVTGQPIALAVPWLDRHVVEFLLGLPPMPFFADKDIVRRAMRGWLPDEIRLRPKTTLRGDPLEVVAPGEVERWVELIESAPLLDELVDRRKLCKEVRQHRGRSGVREQAAVVALAIWLIRS
ncbi:MAG TPA: asparagine synthase-related protein [Thermoanaerobaculia bacterium]|jgi:asparagine synthase (glutamine-hydrolysing)